MACGREQVKSSVNYRHTRLISRTTMMPEERKIAGVPFFLLTRRLRCSFYREPGGGGLKYDEMCNYAKNLA